MNETPDASVMISSCNGFVFTMAMMKKAKPNKDENQKSIKEKLNVEQSHTLGNWKQGQSNSAQPGPNVELYFSLNGYKCNLHFWHAQNEFPFLCIPVSTDRVRTRFKNFLEKLTSLFALKPTRHLLLTKA